MRRTILLYLTTYAIIFVVSDVEGQDFFVGNLESKFIHKSGMNHLPSPANQTNIADIDSSLRHGWTRCPVCFRPPNPSVHDYPFERQLGIEVAAQLRYYFNVSNDRDLTQRIAAIGNKVLNSWVFPLKGYSYDFKVLESEEINAFACPTGFVFVTTGLLEIVESDNEIEAILAHEISHIENRHGLRQYKHLKGLSVISEIASALISAVTEVEVSSLVEFAKSLVLLGHGKELENEADTFAATYLVKKKSQGSEYLSLVLKKFQDLSPKIGGFFSAHPNTADRIRNVESTRIVTIKNPPEMIGKRPDLNDINGISLQFQYGTINQDKIILYGFMRKTQETLYIFEIKYVIDKVTLDINQESLDWEIENISYDELRSELTNPISISAKLSKFKKSQLYSTLINDQQISFDDLDRVKFTFTSYNPYLGGKSLTLTNSSHQ